MTELVKAESGGISAVGDALSAYMKRVNDFSVLEREEEFELAVSLVERGDAGAARRLAESNLRLVVKIAYEYKQAHHNLLDLIQEGNVGLLRAISKFDPYRGNRLSTYSSWWIRAYMLRFILDNHRLVRIGTTQAQRKLFFSLEKEREKLEVAGFVADDATLAARLNVKEAEVAEMSKRLAANDASFDAPVRADHEDGATRYDLTAALAPRPDEQVADHEFMSRLRDKIASFGSALQGREEQILRRRWLTDEPVSLRELGDDFGVSRERVRQLEKRLLDRLKSFLLAELGTVAEDRGVLAAA